MSISTGNGYGCSLLHFAAAHVSILNMASPPVEHEALTPVLTRRPTDTLAPGGHGKRAAPATAAQAGGPEASALISPDTCLNVPFPFCDAIWTNFVTVTFSILQTFIETFHR